MGVWIAGRGNPSSRAVSSRSRNPNPNRIMLKPVWGNPSSRRSYALSNRRYSRSLRIRVLS